MDIAYCKVFPPVGIGRLGNSPDDFFIGPETPGLVPVNGGSYKDAEGRIKRQAARFRVYAFNAADRVVAELTPDHPDVAELTWSVTLANRKASWWEFAGAARVAKILGGDVAGLPVRNAGLVEDRQSLVIGPATATVAGRGQRSADLAGSFHTWPEPIKLGEARTDDAGRLLVLGGAGHSGTTSPDNPLAHYANNDRWFDDTADGPVTVRVTLRSGAVRPRPAVRQR